MEFFVPVQFLLLNPILCVFAQINYVIPNNHSLPPSCKSQICLTLDEYAEQAQVYFVPGATFEFLAGNHTLQHAIIVNDTLNLTLMGDPLSVNDSSDIYINSQEAFFHFHEVQNLTFKSLSLFVAELVTVPDSVIGFKSSTVSILNSRLGGARGHIPTLTALRSVIEIADSTFWGLAGLVGGVISAFKSDIIVSGCYFFGNKAIFAGGVIYIHVGSLSLESTNFYKNSAVYEGVVACDNCTLNITGDVNFTKNFAMKSKGALALNHATVIVSGPVIFYENIGGALVLCATYFQHLLNTKHIQFIRNAANNGGAIACNYCGGGKSNITLSACFINNTAGDCGGAVYSDGGEIDITFHDAYFEGNQRSALWITDTRVIFRGVTRLIRNMGERGGGLYSKRSFILFMGPKNILYSNNASTGGAIYSVYGNITFSVDTLFLANKASTEGGALYALGTAILLSNVTRFIRNSAVNGGAFFEQSSTFIFDMFSQTNTSHNYAYEYGGAIFNRDIASYTQCNYDNMNDREYSYLSYCFIGLKLKDMQNTVRIYSYNDSAGKDGMFLFGGLLDRCQIRTYERDYTPYEWIRLHILWIVERQQNRTEYYRVPQIQSNSIKKLVTSQPYQLCLCSYSISFNCPSEKVVSIYRGQTLSLILLALDQTRSPVSSTVKMSKSSSIRLLPNQDPQLLQQGCSTLTYNIHSNDTYEEVVLYPDGPCRDTGFAAVVVKVTLLTCPNGFIEAGDHCVCEERLQEYADCFIDDSVYIVRKTNMRFWMGTQWNDNGTYIGLILYRTCPADYCTEAQNVRLTLDDLDKQCEQKRSGVLCGACATNYSLMLGSSKCNVCSDWCLSLLLLFATAGIILVIFLSVLRLTIATGFLNSVILYANTVQVNKSIFFAEGTRNILTVFVAWVNLDFGFQVCFYNGMDAYAQTWLQFAFPIYVWVLVGLIILISRYSITVSKLIGHNPIAVLATIILMSYTKILKIIIEVFSSVELEYPDNKKVVVWLKDANVPYLQSKHLVLTVVTVLILVFFFLPFTGLLLVGHKLYRFSGRKWIHPVLKNLKPFLDSYHAPYRNNTRYWTGFLLLVRCALYIVFSYNSLGGTRKSLLAINIVFTALLIITWLSVYRQSLVTFVEGSVFLNLVVLATVTLAGLASSAVVYLLVGVVFVTMLSIVVYHFHIAYTVKTEMWMKLKTSMADIVEKIQGNKKNNQAQVNDAGKVTASQNYPLAEPSRTVVDLREPLLEK